MNRRALLASFATGGIVSTAGCLDSLTGTQNESFQLGYVAVHNFTENAHQITIRVMRNGASVHRSTHDVAGRDGVIVESAIPECDWGSTPGRYEVAVRIDDGDWVTESFQGYDTDGGDCSVALAEGRLREEERLALGYHRACDYDNPPDGLCSFDQ
ncbi:hypothetical protein G3A49_18210 [Haloferax volcanii]|uniref:Lipoprotein n=1 Tax=Haloferax volcanii TaxID=2246 RepID=A0A558G8A5_HALVO|nr:MULTISPECIES: hypothetical protein [Haloferax]ELK51787.1 hypothetical protein D320_14715 [Haloferax sp. BAB-2207]QIB79915.1 hypothetical protein G3A49_18210 [Haloferax alexandrinus]TVT93979.1 hypothetical protein FQA18_14420 [Haloferax volcanii]